MTKKKDFSYPANLPPGHWENEREIMKDYAFYDGEKLWKTYHLWGRAASGPRLREWAKENMPNPQSGKVSQMGPYFSMWAWAFDNPDDAFPLWRDWYFACWPEKPIPRFEDFLIELRDRGKNIRVSGGKKAYERFLAKYNLPREVNVGEGYVIQVTKPNHFLFKRLLKVHGAEPDGTIEAAIFNPDGSTTNHQLEPMDYGVIGKAII